MATDEESGSFFGGLSGRTIYFMGEPVVYIPPRKASGGSSSGSTTTTPTTPNPPAPPTTPPPSSNNSSPPLKVMPWHSVIAKYFDAPNEQPAKGYKGGGLVRGCGAAQRGKTKGKMR